MLSRSRISLAQHLRRTNDTVFDEESFSWILQFERKRVDRTGNPFLLVLLKLDSQLLYKSRHIRLLIKGIIQALKACTRQTDILGWYQNDTVLGIIFTDLSQEHAAVTRIQENVKKAFLEVLTPEQINSVTLSFHLYPHKNKEKTESLADDHLYPDMKQKKASQALKRAIDILGSLTLIVLLSPVFIVVAIAIKLTSRGPIFFKQKRLGRFGQTFTILKFRSMYIDIDSKIHEQYMKEFINSSKKSEGELETLKHDGLFKMTKDPRITPLGRFLRRTSLDELPQFLNVLVGTMSLVGPRPAIPYEVEHYDTWHLRRIWEVPPGITGQWQVKGRSRVVFDDMVRLDLKYIDEWSILTDMILLLQTPWVVLKGDGAC